MGVQGMVTRTGWDGTSWGVNQRITVAEAIRVNTFNGAYASKEESLKGSIATGIEPQLRRQRIEVAHHHAADFSPQLEAAAFSLRHQPGDPAKDLRVVGI